MDTIANPTYLIQREGSIDGPCTIGQIEQLKASGQLQSEDLVKKDGAGDWSLCRIEFPGLFTQPRTAPASIPKAPAPVRPTDTPTAEEQFRLGLKYNIGDGVPQSTSQAAAFYRQAAERGHAVAQNNLGLLYMNGESVPRDLAQAEVWFLKAAEQRLAMAWWNLSVLYDESRGKQELASKYLLQAARNGIPEARKKLKLILYVVTVFFGVLVPLVMFTNPGYAPFSFRAAVAVLSISFAVWGGWRNRF